MKIHKIFTFLGILLAVTIVSCSKKIKQEPAKKETIPTASVPLKKSTLWEETDLSSIEIIGYAYPVPTKYRTLTLKEEAMRKLLAGTVATDTQKPSQIVDLPNPKGGFERFEVVETSTVDKGLLAKYPYLRTYSGKGIDNPTSTVKLDFMPNGFHAYIFSTDGSIIISPVSKGDNAHYFCFFKQFTGEVKQNFETDSIASGNDN
jgi:hypothetical protein